MDKKTALVVVGIVIVIFGAVGYVHFTGNSTQISDPDNNKITPDEVMAVTAQGRYVDYTERSVVDTDGIKLLFFHAPWCPQCRSIEASIEQDGVPDNVTVFKVDYDSNQELRQKYDVTLQTTFVRIDNRGNKVNSYVAYDEPQFSSVERALLP